MANNKFRSNLQAEQLATLLALKEDGAKWKAILKETGLSHSKAELAFMEHEAFEESEFEVAELTPEFVAYCRNDLRIGWGPIMVWTQSSEGKVRKAWEAATNIHSDCTRVGRGGRFKFDDAELYVGELKPKGTFVDADQPLMREVAREAAHGERLVSALLAKETPELKAIAEGYGIKVAKRPTKAKLAIDIKNYVLANGVAVPA